MKKLGNNLIIGDIAGSTEQLHFPKEKRDKHLYICGSTGTGKSKLLESLIRQDIIAWGKTKCGLLVLDPHGSLYDGLMSWLAWHRPDRPITANASVIVDNFIEAMAYVWGQAGTNATPLFARWGENLLHTLYDNNHTLIEAKYLLSRVSKRTRTTMSANLDDDETREDWEFANTLNPEKFEAQIGSTINRLRRFIKNETMRPMFGQTGASLDMARVIEEGSIVLVNLATEKGKISKEVSELFGTLLVSDLWTSAQERGKPAARSVKPFYVYIDECQKFVTPTLAENLDEARGYGIFATLANQFPLQFESRGEAGKRVYRSIMENASSKVVFRLSHEDNLIPMAKWLFMGVMNPDEIKLKLYSTKVMGYVEEYRTAYSRGTGETRSTGQSRTLGTTENTSGSLDENLQANDASHWASGSSDSHGETESTASSETHSETESSVFIPQMGTELSQVQFRSLEEQLFRAMAVLFDQKQRQGVARLVEMRAPVSIVTPTVKAAPSSPERVEEYRNGLLKKLDFALPGAEARARIKNRHAQISAAALPAEVDEPQTTKRRIKS